MERKNSESGRPTRRPGPDGLTDAELDQWILARLTMAGVDLGVLPDDDADAPADRRRILASARRFIRSTLPALLDFEMDVQEVPPIMYPSQFSGRVSPGGKG